MPHSCTECGETCSCPQGQADLGLCVHNCPEFSADDYEQYGDELGDALGEAE